MQTIGVYDSGIGGLTVLKHILDGYVGNDIFYFADNARHPFGNSSPDELFSVVEDGIKRALTGSDIVVVACNTASTMIRSRSRGFSRGNVLSLPELSSDKPVLGLFPPVAESGSCFDINAPSARDTLLMATQSTIAHLDIPKETAVASTPALATMIEERASESLDMRPLLPYLTRQLAQFEGVKRVILGCSHYPFCKREIASVLKGARFFDGVPALMKTMSAYVKREDSRASKITFEFSGMDESKKYARILRELMNGKKNS